MFSAWATSSGVSKILSMARRFLLGSRWSSMANGIGRR
jgi:hypothetical protein